MQAFGDLVRVLMERRGLTGTKLSELIELSPTSISKILKGHSKPKQITFSRLLKALCKSPEEEQAMLKAFTGETHDLPEILVEETETSRREEIARAERYLEMKTQSIAFRQSVARELDKASIPYEAELCDGIYSTDFLIEQNGQRIALECKYNVRRDMEKAVTIAEILLDKLSCSLVSIVVPFLDPATDPASSLPQGIRIELTHTLLNRLTSDFDQEVKQIQGKAREENP